VSAEPSRLARRLGLFDAVVTGLGAMIGAGVFAAIGPAAAAAVAVGALVTTVVLVADLRGAIGFSSFAVLTSYGIANASAWTVPAEQRRWPQPIAALGVVLAFTLPTQSVLGGLVVLALGAAVWLVRAGVAAGRR
jgi:APA family basic amino acid/polyamine antiporter